MLFTGLKNGYHGEYITASDGDVFGFGTEKITVFETPGHTVGGISLLSDKAVFVGDVVFEGDSYGRVDLPGADYESLKTSIEKIKSLPSNVLVYSGHGKEFKISEIKMNLL